MLYSLTSSRRSPATRSALLLRVALCVLTVGRCVLDVSAAEKNSAAPSSKVGDCCEPSKVKTRTDAAPVSLLELSTTPWIESGSRSKRFPFEFSLSDQNGKTLSKDDFAGKPIAMSFVYTRCKNQNKCPLVADTLGKLQKELTQLGLQDKVHLVLMTYDPENDLPGKLVRYGAAHQIKPSATAHLVRPDPGQKEEFFKALDVAVNFKGYDVNIHGIQLLLFDRQSRFVRSYHSVIWDNGVVVKDLAKLAEEVDRER